MPRLIILSGDEIGREILVKGEVVLGRNPQCAVPLLHASVSREHARIAFPAGRATIVDLKSSNGTFVNGKRVEQAELQPGDEIRLGQFLLRFAAEVEVEEIQLEDDPAPALPSLPTYPQPAAPARKAISKAPVRPIPVVARNKAALFGQDVLQYGGYYRFVLVLGALLLAGGVFFCVKYLSSKLAAKAEKIEAEEEVR